MDWSEPSNMFPAKPAVEQAVAREPMNGSFLLGFHAFPARLCLPLVLPFPPNGHSIESQNPRGCI
jgi:hypothetical protein